MSGIFKGFKGFLKLWLFAFKNADSRFNITVQRMALPVIFRSIFSRSKVLVVFHHYDKKENLSLFYHLNSWLLIKLLSAGLSKVKVAVVADYWKRFMVEQGVSPDCIHVVPNLFKTERYTAFQTTHKKNKICLGQWSDKVHKDVLTLAQKLSEAGYECFFTTPVSSMAMQSAYYTVFHYTFDEYCSNIAECLYTVCLTNINEGWNRVAHESILMGTSVIGNSAGGLEELLCEANQVIVQSADEAYNYIACKKHPVVNPAFLNKYDINRISYYAEPISAFYKA